MGRLNHRKKMEWYPLIRARQGNRCLYCNKEFSELDQVEFDHLHNNPKDSRFETICLGHKTCNNRKKFDHDLQILAAEKMVEYERAVYACERSVEEDDLSSQQKVSKRNRQIAESSLLGHTMNGRSVYLSDIVNAIVSLCWEDNDNGSQAAVRRYIEVLANPFNGKYVIETDTQGRKLVRRKTEKELHRN